MWNWVQHSSPLFSRTERREGMMAEINHSEKTTYESPRAMRLLGPRDAMGCVHRPRQQ
jgi:hypothetical protein